VFSVFVLTGLKR